MVTIGLAEAGWQNLPAVGESMVAIIAYRTGPSIWPRVCFGAAKGTAACV